MSQNSYSRKNFIQTFGAIAGASFFTSSIPKLNFLSTKKSNTIVAENEKPGTTDWKLTRVEQFADEAHFDGWIVRKEIQGYVSHLSIKAGETLKFYVSTDPADDYKLEIFRMGYYSGKGGRLVKTINSLKGTPQPMPQDGPNNIIECQWNEAYNMVIPDDWVSGVYLGKLSTYNTIGDAYVIFIVRDDRKADLMFQCSDFTWVSYNRWPQFRSLYDTPQGAWLEGGQRFDAGFVRPYGIYWNVLPANFEALTNGSGEFLLWEFPLAYWLEKEGYDVTYISNLDTHVDGPGLLRSKAFLSVGHDEYWTQEMYDNVVIARDAGVNLAFLCGNSVFGRIELLPDSHGNPHRGMKMLGGFREMSAQLMGSRSYGVGFGDWICNTPDHWVYEKSGMKKGDRIPHIIGWEFHGYPVAETHKDLVVLAEGPVGRGGRISENRRHAATLYTALKGNIVFNAATCWWNLLLSAPPGFINPPYQAHHIRKDHPKYPPGNDCVERPPRHEFHKGDERVQQITRNVLDRMIALKIK